LAGDEEYQTLKARSSDETLSKDERLKAKREMIRRRLEFSAPSKRDARYALVEQNSDYQAGQARIDSLKASVTGKKDTTWVDTTEDGLANVKAFISMASGLPTDVAALTQVVNHYNELYGLGESPWWDIFGLFPEKPKKTAADLAALSPKELRDLSL